MRCGWLITFVTPPGAPASRHPPCGGGADLPLPAEVGDQCVGRVSDGGTFVSVLPFTAPSWDWVRKMLVLRSALRRSAPLRSAPIRSASLRSAPPRSAPMRYAPLRAAPL